jgi:hypothetical protein
MSGLSRRDLLTWRGAVVNAVYWVGTRALVKLLDVVGRRGVAPLRAAQGLPLGPAATGRSCAPAVQLDTNSWLLEPPQPIAPPEVRSLGAAQ